MKKAKLSKNKKETLKEHDKHCGCGEQPLKHNLQFNIRDRKFSISGTKEKVQIKDTFIYSFTEQQLVGFANSISDAVKADMFGSIPGKPIPYEYPIQRIMFEFVTAGIIGALYLMFTLGVIGNITHAVTSFWQFLLMLIAWGVLTLIVKNIYKSTKRKFGIKNIYQLIFSED